MSRETRREKDRLSERAEKRGGMEARISDKRVHESLANVLISGERGSAGENVFFLMEAATKSEDKKRTDPNPRPQRLEYFVSPLSSVYIEKFQGSKS